jgi:DNA polymerase III sliding clamp (beta) subunit (PCNA family)
MRTEIKFLVTAVGDNFTRRNLMFLNIKVKDGKAIMTAANAYIIKRVETALELPDGEYMIDGENLKAAAKAAKKKSDVYFTESGLNVDGALFQFDLSAAENFEYPDLEGLMDPRRYGGTASIEKIGFNVPLLINVLKNAPDDTVKFSFDASSTDAGQGHEGPTMITFAGFPSYSALIMPTRIKW